MPAQPSELILVLLYIVFGPIAWGLFLFGMNLGHRRMKLMHRAPGGGPLHPVEGPNPFVTIMIPAKDEGERIRMCLQSALNQDYGDFEVVAIDDRSTDNTGAIMDALAHDHPNLKVLHKTQLPPAGWTGKNFALHEGQKLARGEWILFMDSDVVLDPDVLTVAMAVCRRKNFDMMSLLPRLDNETFGERLMVPLCAAAASGMYLIAMSNVGEVKGHAFANGQFMLMSRAGYDKIGGHEAVRDKFCEDVSIAKLFKENALRPRVSWGTEFCSVRMYTSLPATIKGWARIYYAARFGSPWRILAAMAWVMLCVFSIFPAAVWAAHRLQHPTEALFGNVAATWTICVGLHFLLGTTAIGILYWLSRNRWYMALIFWFLGAPLLFYTLYLAVKHCATGKVTWRGTSYSNSSAASVGAATSVK